MQKMHTNDTIILEAVKSFCKAWVAWKEESERRKLVLKSSHALEIVSLGLK